MPLKPNRGIGSGGALVADLPVRGALDVGRPAATVTLDLGGGSVSNNAVRPPTTGKGHGLLRMA
jgi:hypothetical protein